MSGAIPPLAQYVFVAWRLIKLIERASLHKATRYEPFGCLNERLAPDTGGEQSTALLPLKNGIPPSGNVSLLLKGCPFVSFSFQHAVCGNYCNISVRYCYTHSLTSALDGGERSSNKLFANVVN
jgi:hypothetical protein